MPLLPSPLLPRLARLLLLLAGLLACLALCGWCWYWLAHAHTTARGEGPDQTDLWEAALLVLLPALSGGLVFLHGIQPRRALLRLARLLLAAESLLLLALLILTVVYLPNGVDRLTVHWGVGAALALLICLGAIRQLSGALRRPDHA
jgi:hypothetical protein